MRAKFDIKFSAKFQRLRTHTVNTTSTVDVRSEDLQYSEPECAVNKQSARCLNLTDGLAIELVPLGPLMCLLAHVGCVQVKFLYPHQGYSISNLFLVR